MITPYDTAMHWKCVFFNYQYIYIIEQQGGVPRVVGTGVYKRSSRRMCGAK